MNKPVRQIWVFSSDSNPTLEYQTLQYADGSTSCNCKGWTRRTASDGSRSCKHTRWVDLKVADQHCVASHTYSNKQPPTPTTNETKATNRRLGERKFAF